MGLEDDKLDENRTGIINYMAKQLMIIFLLIMSIIVSLVLSGIMKNTSPLFFLIGVLLTMNIKGIFEINKWETPYHVHLVFPIMILIALSYTNREFFYFTLGIIITLLIDSGMELYYLYKSRRKLIKNIKDLGNKINKMKDKERRPSKRNSIKENKKYPYKRMKQQKVKK